MSKKKPRMIGREASLAMAIALIQAGSSVDVVGSRGSGRSAFLHELKRRLESKDWTVLVVRGVASLKSNPLVAMQLAGIGEPADSRHPVTIQRMAEALTQRIRPPKTVLFLDDWDDLDEASWGVAESVRRWEGLPIVLSRLQGLRARHTPSGLEASTMEPSYVIDMAPVKFEELEEVVSEHLGGPIDPGAISRVYAKSGGVVGLAINLVDAAVREGRVRLDAGLWIATRDLWSPGLRGVVEAYLEALDNDARDALEIIALIGVSDTETVRRLVDWETLERLEERAMIQLYASGSRQLVTVVPPLLVEFFRHEPRAARRIRLTEHIIDSLGSSGSADAIVVDQIPEGASVADSDALFVRLVQEGARTRRLVTHAEWVRSPNPSTAVPYLKALLAVQQPAGRVDHVLDHTIDGDGDERAHTEFAVIRAQWRAYVHRDVDGALAELAAVAPVHAFGRMADAAAVTIETNLRGVPDDFADRLEVTDDLPESIRITLWEAQMAVLLAQGRFDGARRVFQNIRDSDKSAVGFLPSVLFGLVLLGEGDHSAALAWAQRGYDEAHGYLDVDGMRAHAYVACLCLTVQGAYSRAEEMIGTVFAIGDPPPFPRSSQLALLNIASVIAVRRGRSALAERYANELDALPVPDGPMPGQSRFWSHAQLLVFAGRHSEAATVVWEGSDTLWDRGARFSAVMGYLTCLEVERSPERLQVAVGRARELGGEFLLAHADYVQAFADEDVDALLALVPRLAATGRLGHAVSAFSHAVDILTDRGETAGATAVAAERQTFLESLGSNDYDVTRFMTRAVTLTQRELEIVEYVEKGLSNGQIAAHLVLSVRTVESHLHRISRKVGARNRKELAELVSGIQP
ncbi:helix-turn-helix transcriptional regulator [Leifsonia poae]|uniref:helix-turn-helix transcriptional regulator n=1 Tax=Leifsonia poae TaxID=110933 RepID=UPI001CBBAB2D|nr:LuxR family transcriptional regulator [Leifsonia poae]